MNFSLVFSIALLTVAINAILIATNIFRQGIDDGTEIILTSKSITRSELIYSKLIVFICIILFQSIIAFVVPIFLKFDDNAINNPLPLCFGYMIVSIITSIMFGSIAIVFCLLLKKVAATLITLGICCSLMLLTTVNNLILKSPGLYIDNKNYSLKNVSVDIYNQTNNSTKTINGYLLEHNKNIINSTDVNNQTNIIESVYDLAEKKSNIKLLSYIDPIYQLVLMYNLGNFMQTYTTPINQQSVNQNFENKLWINGYSSFSSIDLADGYKYKSLMINDNDYCYIKNNSWTIWTQRLGTVLTVDKNSTINKIKESNSITSNIIIVPQLSYSGSIANNDLVLNDSLMLNIYVDNPDMAIAKIFDNTNNANSIANYYLKWINISIKELNSKFNWSFSTFFQSYYFLALNMLIQNIMTNPEQTTNIIVNNGNNISISNKDLQSLLKKYIENQKIINISLYNEFIAQYLVNKNLPTSIFYYAIIRWCLENVQYAIINQLNQNVNNQANENIMKLNLLNYNNDSYDSGVYTFNKKYIDTFLQNINNILKSPMANTNLVNNLLNQLNSGFIGVSNNPYQLIKETQMISFSNGEINYYLDLSSLVIAWLFISISLLIISSAIYAKKDFK